MIGDLNLLFGEVLDEETLRYHNEAHDRLINRRCVDDYDEEYYDEEEGME